MRKKKKKDKENDWRCRAKASLPVNSTLGVKNA